MADEDLPISLLPSTTSANDEDYFVIVQDGVTKKIAYSDLFSSTGGISSINTLTSANQLLSIGTSGTSPNWASAGAIHTLNIPYAGGTGVTLGGISKSDYDSFANKQAALGYAPVNRAGDTMTGPLILSGVDSNSLSAITRGYVDDLGNILTTALSTKVPTSRTLTIFGTTYDLSTNRSWVMSSTNVTDALGFTPMRGSNNLSEISSASSARSNLGLVIGTHVQAWDGDLDAIAALSGTSGFLKKTAANTWSLDTSSYVVNSSMSNGYLPYFNGTGLLNSTMQFNYGTNYDVAAVGSGSRNYAFGIVSSAGKLLAIYKNDASANQYYVAQHQFSSENNNEAFPVLISARGNTYNGANVFSATDSTYNQKPFAALHNTSGTYVWTVDNAGQQNYRAINDTATTVIATYTNKTGTQNAQFTNGGFVLGSSSINTSTQLELQGTTKALGLPLISTANLPTYSNREGMFMYDSTAKILKYSDNVGYKVVATGKDYTLPFKRVGALSYSTLDVDGGSFTIGMGYLVPFAMTLKDISVVLGTSSATGADSLQFIVKKLAVGTGNTGTSSQISLGGGTTVATLTINSGGALATAYYRNASALDQNISLSAGDVIWVETNNFTSWSASDILCNLIVNG